MYRARHSSPRRMFGTVSLVLALMTVLGVSVIGPTVASATAGADGPTRQNCVANGSVLLYTDASRTTLVDAFAITDAPTEHFARTTPYLDNWVIRDGERPGVAVVGALTGNPYLFGSRSKFIGPSAPSGTMVRVGSADWRVTAQDGGGIVADSRNQQIRVYVDGEAVVQKFFGPTQHGLFLSGFLGLGSCTS